MTEPFREHSRQHSGYPLNFMLVSLKKISEGLLSSKAIPLEWEVRKYLTVCGNVWMRERESEKDKERQREKDTERERQRERKKGRRFDCIIYI